MSRIISIMQNEVVPIVDKDTTTKKAQLPKWNIISEVTNCQIGKNPLLQKRFLYGVERLEHKSTLIDNEMKEVHSLNFNRKGNLLVNNSENKIFIWNWDTGKRRHLFYMKKYITEFPVQTKWLTMDSLITTIRKGEVFLIDLNHDKLKKVANLHEENRITVLHDETPPVVLSASDNGNVFSIDIRQAKAEKLFQVKENGKTILLNTIDSNPFNNNEFCFTGESCYVRVYDRRNVSEPLHELLPLCMRTNDQCYCAFYNYSGTEILASYANEEIYLFDMLKLPCRVTHTYMSYFDNFHGEGVKFFGSKSEFVICGSDSNDVFIWDKNTEEIVKCLKTKRKSNEKKGIHHVEGHPYLPILVTEESRGRIGIYRPFVFVREEDAEDRKD